MSRDSDGTRLEGLLQTALKAHQARRASFIHRFADTKAARGYLPVQPGDFLWLLPGVPAVLIEAKSTTTGAPLRKLMSPGQTGKHRLWMRAGHLSAFVYSDLHHDTLVWYPGNRVINDNRLDPLWEGQLSQMEEMLLSVEEIIRD